MASPGSFIMQCSAMCHYKIHTVYDREPKAKKTAVSPAPFSESHLKTPPPPAAARGKPGSPWLNLEVPNFPRCRWLFDPEHAHARYGLIGKERERGFFVLAKTLPVVGRDRRSGLFSIHTKKWALESPQKVSS